MNIRLLHIFKPHYSKLGRISRLINKVAIEWIENKSFIPRKFELKQTRKTAQCGVKTGPIQTVKINMNFLKNLSG